MKSPQRRYYERNKQKVLERSRAWNVAHRPQRKVVELRSHLKTRYNITLEQYQLLQEVHGGRCALCNSTPSGKAHLGKLHVDHNHETGRVRGLLCNDCNLILGHSRDNADLLRRAAEYIEKHK